jgi:hypothetical protein
MSGTQIYAVPGVAAWTYPLWFGEHVGGYIFGGEVLPGGDTFVALFTTQARAERFIAADTYFHGEVTFAAEIINEDELHEWLTELKQDGKKFLAFNPVSPNIPLDRAVRIVDLLGCLTLSEPT